MSVHSFYHFIKNPQTTIALTFLTHIISAIGGVSSINDKACLVKVSEKSFKNQKETHPNNHQKEKMGPK